MGEKVRIDIDQAKKNIRKVRTKKISALALILVMIIVLGIVGTGIFFHLQWREKSENNIEAVVRKTAHQIGELVKPSEWTLDYDYVSFREDREVAAHGDSQYQIDISAPAEGLIWADGYYDPVEELWYNNEIVIYIYHDWDLKIDDVSRLFAAALAVYYETDAKTANDMIRSYLYSIPKEDNMWDDFTFGVAGNVYATLGSTYSDGGWAWFMEAGSYN